MTKAERQMLETAAEGVFARLRIFRAAFPEVDLRSATVTIDVDGEPIVERTVSYGDGR